MSFQAAWKDADDAARIHRKRDTVGFSEYSKPPITVQAEQVEDEPRSVITPNGAVTAQPGDWEVRYPDGNVTTMTDEEFQDDFGDKGSEDSGHSGKSPAVSESGDETDDDDTDESAVSNGGPDGPETIEDRSGIGAESERETRKPASPPPPARRR